MTTPLTNHVKPALRSVSKRGAYFLKQEVVTETLRRADVLDAVIEIRHTYRGKGLDDAILRAVDADVGKALRARDDHGLRMFESYSVGRGPHRWRRFTAMDADDVDRVLRDLHALRASLDAKIIAYEIIHEEMARVHAKRVQDVYDRAWRRIRLAGVAVDKLAS